MEEREEIRLRIARHMCSKKGVGVKTADMCSRLAMEVIDDIVKESKVESKESTSPGDFPWDKIPHDYSWVAVDGNSESFVKDKDILDMYVFRVKPTPKGDHSNIAFMGPMGSGLAKLMDFVAFEELPQWYLDTKIEDSLIKRPE